MGQTNLKSFSFYTQAYTQIKNMNEEQFKTHCQEKMKKYEEDDDETI